MMGPETMGVADANITWTDEKVCRNFLCGTCPHTLFTNTVRSLPRARESKTAARKVDVFMFAHARLFSHSYSHFPSYRLSHDCATIPGTSYHLEMV